MIKEEEENSKLKTPTYMRKAIDKYYLNNRDKIIQRQQIYYKENYEENAEYRHNYYLKKKNDPEYINNRKIYQKRWRDKQKLKKQNNLTNV